jgi:hypothetical protein
VKDKEVPILTNNTDNDFFPAVERPLVRVGLYTSMWVVGMALLIIIPIAIASLISK